jgi:type IV fimbrial biogenesis protein FimT
VLGKQQILRIQFVSRLRARCRACGFTLVELMVTIAIAAILLMIAVPSFTTMLENNRETSAANSLVNALTDARNNALRTGASVTICPTANPTDTICAANWNTGWGVISAPAGGASVLLASGNLGAYNVTVKASGGSNPLVFTPRGLVTGLITDLFTFCDSRGSVYARSVVVNTGGYIQTSPTPGLDPDGVALTCP